MYTQQQQPTNFQSTDQRLQSLPLPTFKCYLRTPDMKCKVENISADQSVTDLKEQVKSVLGLGSEVQSSAIKLVVNENELTDEVKLSLHLYQKAIIHVLVSQPKKTSDQTHKKTHLLIKQPPISCHPQSIENLSVQLPISSLKSTIIQFYQQKYPTNPIANLTLTDLYLVYGGRILNDSNTISDYDIQENGVIYVVNGKIYAREVTRQQAERRIEEVKRGHYNEVQINKDFEKDESNQFVQENSAINESQDVVFNIIENIVHDEDSDVEGQTAGDLTRSQKIIRRYDSLNRALPTSNDEDHVVTQEQPELQADKADSDNFLNQQAINQEKPQELTSVIDQIHTETDEGNQQEQKRSLSFSLGEQTPQQNGHHTNEAQQQPESQQAVHQYVSSVSKKIVNIQDEQVVEEEQQSQNIDKNVSQSFENHSDSVPQKDENQDEDLLL